MSCPECENLVNTSFLDLNDKEKLLRLKRFLNHTLIMMDSLVETDTDYSVIKRILEVRLQLAKEFL